MTSSLEARLQKLERDAGKPVRFVLVNQTHTEEQDRFITALQAEGHEVRFVANPYQRKVADP